MRTFSVATALLVHAAACTSGGSSDRTSPSTDEKPAAPAPEAGADGKATESPSAPVDAAAPKASPPDEKEPVPETPKKEKKKEEFLVAPAPASPPPWTPQADVTLRGGNVGKDPVGLLLAAVESEFDGDSFSGPIHIEHDQIFDHETKGVPLPEVESYAGQRKEGAVPLYRDGDWFYGEGLELRRRAETSTRGRKLATVAGPIRELALRGKDVFVLHDREIEEADLAVGSDFHEYEILLDHGETDIEFSERHVISRVPTKGGKPKVVVNEHRKIESWSVGGADGALLVWFVEFEEGEGPDGETKEFPAMIRVLDLAGSAEPRDVAEIVDEPVLSLVDGVAIDETHVYWIATEEKTYILRRKPHRSDGPEEVLLRGPEFCFQCRTVVHDGRVYWDHDDGVLRMPVAGGRVEILKMTGKTTAERNAVARDAWVPWERVVKAE